MQLYEANKQLRATGPRGPRPARDPQEDRGPGLGRAGQRPAALGPGDDRARTSSSRRCGTPSSASATSNDGPRCSRSSRTSPANRMPSVADLLKQAAPGREGAWRSTRPATTRRWPATSGPAAAAKPTEPAPGGPKPPTAVPSVVDRESSQQPPDTKEEKPGPGSPPKTPRLLLPKTTLAGGVKPGQPGRPARRRAEGRRGPERSSATSWPSSRRSPTS